MRVALVSNGPSAVAYATAKRNYAGTIGVNKAVTRWGLDWWCFCDFKTYEQEAERVVGQPSIFCREPAGRKIVERLRGKPQQDFIARRAEGRVLIHEGIEGSDSPPLPLPWFSYSGCAALVLAVHLGATEIDLYGVDLGGHTDLRNEVNYSRDANRWKREIELWEALRDWAVAKEIEIQDGCPSET